ncbi:hypothetical protein ACFQZC_12610 [Streptacidiphilus monticola]
MPQARTGGGDAGVHPDPAGAAHFNGGVEARPGRRSLGKAVLR